MTLGLPKSHFFLKLSQNERASEASGVSEASGATKTKHLWVQSHQPPHSGRKTGRDQKTLSIFCERKGLITTKFHSPEQK